MKLKNEHASSLIALALLSFQSLTYSICRYSVKGGKWSYSLVVDKRADKKGTSAFPSCLSEWNNWFFLKNWKIKPTHFIEVNYSTNL